MRMQDWAVDQIFTNVTVHLGLWDAVKVLLFRRLYVDVVVDCESLPGRTSGSSRVRVPLIRLWPRREQGWAETPVPAVNDEP